jgi:hypothetical protein
MGKALANEGYSRSPRYEKARGNQLSVPQPSKLVNLSAYWRSEAPF